MRFLEVAIQLLFAHPQIMHSGSPNPTFKGQIRALVSTPAIMERFVSIEREILQIESLVQLEEGSEEEIKMNEKIKGTRRQS
ncbi:hypothetical protein ACE6H2_020470 [Prunus campanulata]